jgi:hypothetical protein
MNLALLSALLVIKASKLAVALDTSANKAEEFNYIVKKELSCSSGVIKVCLNTDYKVCKWKTGTAEDLANYQNGMKDYSTHLKAKAASMQKRADFLDKEQYTDRGLELRQKAESILKESSAAREKGKRCKVPMNPMDISSKNPSGTNSRNIIETKDSKLNCDIGVIQHCSTDPTKECDWKNGNAKHLEIYKKGMEDNAKAWDKILKEQEKILWGKKKKDHLLEWKVQSAAYYVNEARDMAKGCSVSKTKIVSMNSSSVDIVETNNSKYSCPSGVIKVCSAKNTQRCDWKPGTAKDLAIYREGMEDKAKELEKKAEANAQEETLEQQKIILKAAQEGARKARATGAKCQAPKKHSSQKPKKRNSNSEDVKYSCSSGVIKVCSPKDGKVCDWKMGTLKDLANYRKQMEDRAIKLEQKAAADEEKAELRNESLDEAKEARASGKKCKAEKKKNKKKNKKKKKKKKNKKKKKKDH